MKTSCQNAMTDCVPPRTDCIASINSSTASINGSSDAKNGSNRQHRRGRARTPDASRPPPNPPLGAVSSEMRPPFVSSLVPGGPISTGSAVAGAPRRLVATLCVPHALVLQYYRETATFVPGYYCVRTRVRQPFLVVLGISTGAEAGTDPVAGSYAVGAHTAAPTTSPHERWYPIRSLSTAHSLDATSRTRRPSKRTVGTRGRNPVVAAYSISVPDTATNCTENGFDFAAWYRSCDLSVGERSQLLFRDPSTILRPQYWRHMPIRVGAYPGLITSAGAYTDLSTGIAMGYA
eukprot:2142578-Rhodomonas_salina.2